MTSRTLAFLVAACSLACSGGSGGGDRMNVLFVSIDTLRADHLTCYGYERPTSPEIDALAADGHRFTSAYTVMATTLPAHLSMFTSLFPAQMGVISNGRRVPDGVQTLAERLSAVGYETGGFVSSYPLHESVQIGQGFDVYDSAGREPRDGGDTVDRALEWLSGRTGDGPFFCFVHSYDPHTWYQVDEPEFTTPFGAPEGVVLPPARTFVEGGLPPRIRRASVNTYDAEIRYADAQLGRLLRYLEGEGLRDETVVVLISDHGETLDELNGEGYVFDHGEYLCKRELHIPLIVWLPPAYEERGPAVHDELVSVLDVMPTILDLLGIECEQPYLGASLTDLMGGGELEPRQLVAERRALESHDRAFLEGAEYSVLDGRLHWITSEARGDRMFDLQADPREERDVSAEHAEEVEAFRKTLAQWRELMSRPLWSSNGELSPEDQKILESLGYGGNAK